MTDFDWSDPLRLEGQLSEEERLVRDTAHEYAQSKLLPRVVSAFREERFDREIMEELGDLMIMLFQFFAFKGELYVYDLTSHFLGEIVHSYHQNVTFLPDPVMVFFVIQVGGHMVSFNFHNLFPFLDRVARVVTIYLLTVWSEPVLIASATGAMMMWIIRLNGK